MGTKGGRDKIERRREVKRPLLSLAAHDKGTIGENISLELLIAVEIMTVALQIPEKRPRHVAVTATAYTGTRLSSGLDGALRRDGGREGGVMS
jgi:hypothetical protein